MIPALAIACLIVSLAIPVRATPANRVGLEKFYGRFLSTRLNDCTTCHLPNQTGKAPSSLAEFPHNAFGHRLALAADELRKAGKKTDIAARLRLIAHEDSDGDGVDNLTELLLGHAPGDPKDRPTAAELAKAPRLRADFEKFLASYRWQPFEPVKRPAVPKTINASWARNPIDAFLAREQEARHLHPRPPAPRAVLLRRVYLDLVGLSPTPDEVKAFEADTSSNAYEKVVDRLLASPRYGERWGRHWMDVWRYSDWAGWADGNQIRDSKPFIWRWRDWIVESLNKDKGYDRMVQEMLAADELCPEDTDALRATGFLVRNFKLLSREQWMEDTLNHTSRAFMGLTLHCAKCHDHKYDPITQKEYYQVRAIFEPHNVRTDRIPGQPDATKDGLVHAFDAEPAAPTYLFVRGDERNPDKSQALTPGVPESLGGRLDIHPVSLPRTSVCPDRREFVVRETISAGEQTIKDARGVVEKAPPAGREMALKALAAAEARHASLLAVLRVEALEDAGKKDGDEWKQAAMETVKRQREQAVKEAELTLETAQAAQKNPPVESKPTVNNGKNAKPPPDPAALQKKVDEAQKALSAARAALETPATSAYQPRALTVFPLQSTGRRLAFARWLTDRQNPLTARVAVNQIWMRHFGEGIVPSVDDFGRNGRKPTHPELLDWMAAELMSNGWRMKPLHRLIVTSSAYRMSSTNDAADAKIDPDDAYLWRMPSRRMEAEVVRDNLLYVSGSLDETTGGPEVDHKLGLTSRRRSIYLRTAAEKQVEFLQIFDNASVSECYERKPSVMPQQALALANSELALTQARALTKDLSARSGADNTKFIAEGFLRVLARRPTAQEQKLCLEFIDEQTRLHTAKLAQVPGTVVANSGAPGTKPGDIPTAVQVTPEADSAVQRAREHLVLVLFNHNDFVTIR